MELFEQLEQDPKRKEFEKKRGRLAKAWAAKLTFERVVWRAVFVVDDRRKTVLIVALDKHDDAYRDAERRV